MLLIGSILSISWWSARPILSCMIWRRSRYRNWSRFCWGEHFLSTPVVTTTATAYDAENDRKNESTPDSSSEPYHKRPMLINPWGLIPSTLSVLTQPSVTRTAIQDRLVHGHAITCRSIPIYGTAEITRIVVTGGDGCPVSVQLLSALHIPVGTLTTSTEEARIIATWIPISCMSIFGTDIGISSACLLQVTTASTCTADRFRRGKLAVCAARSSSVVAYSSLSKATCRPITTITAFIITAVAVFSFFDNAISTFSGCDSGHIIVVPKAIRVHISGSDHGADIPNSTRWKFGLWGRGKWIH